MARFHNRAPMRVRVIVHELDTGQVQSESTINLANPADVRWLQRLTCWAYFNAVSIEIMNAANDHA